MSYEYRPSLDFTGSMGNFSATKLMASGSTPGGYSEGVGGDGGGGGSRVDSPQGSMSRKSLGGGSIKSLKSAIRRSIDIIKLKSPTGATGASSSSRGVDYSRVSSPPPAPSSGSASSPPGM